MRAHYSYEGNINTNLRHADFVFTFTMHCCKQTSDEDQKFERIKLSPFQEKGAKRMNNLA